MTQIAPARATKTRPPMETRYRVIFADAAGERHDVVVPYLPDDPKDRTMLGNALGIASQAAKALASRTVDYDAFGNDSRYLDALDRVADAYVLVGLHKDGECQRYTVDALYADGSGPWTDTVEGVDQEDAEFQGRWQLNLNAEHDPKDLEDFLGMLEEHTVHSVDPTPVTLDELANTVIALVRANKAGQDLAGTIATLAGMVTQLGYHIDQA